MRIESNGAVSSVFRLWLKQRSSIRYAENQIDKLQGKLPTEELRNLRVAYYRTSESLRKKGTDTYRQLLSCVQHSAYPGIALEFKRVTLSYENFLMMLIEDVHNAVEVAEKNSRLEALLEWLHDIPESLKLRLMSLSPEIWDDNSNSYGFLTCKYNQREQNMCLLSPC